MVEPNEVDANLAVFELDLMHHRGYIPLWRKSDV